MCPMAYQSQKKMRYPYTLYFNTFDSSMGEVNLCRAHLHLNVNPHTPNTGNVRVGGGSCHRKRKHKVFAFDKDPRRLELMRRRVDEAGLADTIEARLQDFLEVDPLDRRFAGVTAILLDPSCSGSGIVSTPDRVNDADAGVEEGFVDQRGKGEVGSDDSRVEKLAAFQLRGLLKAMSFSQVRCYIYIDW